MRRKIILDQYFTQDCDAKRCIDKLNCMYPLSSFDILLEPSAGAGAFFKQLPQNKVGIDLQPLCDGIQKLDFFEYQAPQGMRIAVIGNPPFGRRGSLAKKFFQRCSQFSDVIAFILPAIFGKPSFYKTLDKRFHLEYEEPVSQFVMADGTTTTVKCVFQIWKKKEVLRNDIKKVNEHPDFKMIHRHISRTNKDDLNALIQEYDFAFGQVSHKICDINELKRGSQFLIKDLTKDKRVKLIFEKMLFDNLTQYAMGAVSLSQADVYEQYKEASLHYHD